VENSALNLNGKTPPAMPKVSGGASAAYDVDLPWGKLTPRVQVIYRGQEWARIFNVPSLDKVPAYTVANLNLEFDPTGSNSRFTGPYGANLTSQEFIPPRQIIGTIAYAF
jgi:iron complex outermembrane receptor protein